MLSAMDSIYPKGESQSCYAHQSLASSPDSNEGCHWEAEGIICSHKDRAHWKQKTTPSEEVKACRSKTFVTSSTNWIY